MMDSVPLVDSTNDPAFATDADGRILSWNRAAEELFGYSSRNVIGLSCWDLLDGRDVFGNRYCGPGCPLLRMAVQQEATHRCLLEYKASDGSAVRAEVSTISVPGSNSNSVAIVHLLNPRPDDRSGILDPARGSAVSPAQWRLSPRETEVLTLLGNGKGTSEIAVELGVSAATVRNHIDHLLRKLNVHSRTEAVALAFRSGLLG